LIGPKILAFIWQAAQQSQCGGIFTPDRIVVWAIAISALAGNYFQYRNSNAAHVHKTDQDTIGSLERALEQVKRERDERPTTEDLITVKKELAMLMSIDMHQFLDFVALTRRNAALEAECQRLQVELVRKGGKDV
jgi:hypothetical protein